MTLKESEGADILVRRRDPNKEDVYLVTQSRRTAIVQALTAMTAALDAIQASTVQSVLRPVLQATYPWLGALSVPERADFSTRYLNVVTKSLGKGELEDLNVFIKQWQLHAEIRSEKDLQAVLSSPIPTDEFTGVEVTVPPAVGIKRAVHAGKLKTAAVNAILADRPPAGLAKRSERAARAVKGRAAQTAHQQSRAVKRSAKKR